MSTIVSKRFPFVRISAGAVLLVAFGCRPSSAQVAAESAEVRLSLALPEVRASSEGEGRSVEVQHPGGTSLTLVTAGDTAGGFDVAVFALIVEDNELVGRARSGIVRSTGPGGQEVVVPAVSAAADRAAGDDDWTIRVRYVPDGSGFLPAASLMENALDHSIDTLLRAGRAAGAGGSFVAYVALPIEPRAAKSCGTCTNDITEGRVKSLRFRDLGALAPTPARVSPTARSDSPCLTGKRLLRNDIPHQERRVWI